MDLDGGEMLPGCRRDVNIRTQIEVRFNWDKEETWIWEPGWRGDKSRDLDGVEMRPGLSWDAYLETWIGWYGTRMELRYYSLVEKWPGRRWNTHLETFMGLRWCLDGTKMQFSGTGWRRDVTQMEARCKYQDPDWGEIQLRQRRNVHLGARVERRHTSRDLDGVEMGPGLSWDAHLETRMGYFGTGVELRYNSSVEKGPGWRWDTSWNLYGFEMMIGWN